MNDHLERTWKEAVVAQSRHNPGGTEENHEKPWPGLPMSRPKFEPSTSQIKVWSITTMPNHLVKRIISAESYIKLKTDFLLMTSPQEPPHALPG
jgi:hypothetical protein